MGPLREDFAGQRQLRFRVQGKPIHLFKHKGMSTHQVYLRILVYAMFLDRYPSLEIEPRLNNKHHPCVAGLDFTGEVQFWAQCGPIDADGAAWVLKHTEAEEVVLATEDIAFDMDKTVAALRRHIHYRYTTGRLRILVFRPLDEWFDPDRVDVPPDAYQLYEF
ncbi:hypothetical protein D3C72_1359620 [compost metagenome]